MKKQIIKSILALVMVFGSAPLIGCIEEHNYEGYGEEVLKHHTNTADKKEELTEYLYYLCPMDCEGGKVYEEPSQCPECSMEMVGVAEETEAESDAAHVHKHIYACPMHSKITGHAGDKCSKCGMDFKKLKD